MPTQSAEAKKNSYLSKPVTQIKISGQDNFLVLMECLLQDLEAFSSEKEYAIWYTAIALNLYKHNSTYRPTHGFGRAQAIEEQKPLLYFRSQAHHPHRVLFDKIAKDESEKGKKSLLPRNKPFEELLKDTFDKHSGVMALDRLNRRGFIKPGKSLPDYFGLFIAHSGLKRNNFQIYCQGLEHAINDDTDCKQVVKNLLTAQKSLPKNITKITAATAKARIEELKNYFAELQVKAATIKTVTHLQTKMAQQRQANMTKIINQCANIDDNYIKFHVMPGTNTLNIILYPNFVSNKREIKNYAEGVTNALLGFFQGLLNYHAKKRGLYIQTDRRQSFGFLRPTLTDTESLTLRLSFGLEPEKYNDVVADSLKDLADALAHYDFADATHDLVKKCFKTVGKPKGKKVTEKTDQLILSRVNTNEKQLQAAIAAEHYLDEKQSAQNGLKAYLQNYIIDNKDDDEAPQPIMQVKTIQQPTTTIVFDILANLLQHALSVVTDAADVILSNNKNDGGLFYRCAWHTLSKLYKNCDHALSLLNALTKYEESHLYAKANLLIENILEYLISLDAIKHINLARMSQISSENMIKELKRNERFYAAYHTGVNCVNTKVYFTDSGQQANVLALLALQNQFEASKLYVFPKSYYELNLFLRDVECVTSSAEAAEIIFLDFSDIAKFTLAEYKKVKGVVIDTTHYPDLNNPQLKQLIQQLHEKNIWVFLTSSALKHDQLGLDKYQVGKIITLAPMKTPTKKIPETLNNDVIDTLSTVSKAATHPAILSYLKIVNDVLNEKNLLVKNGHHGFFQLHDKVKDVTLAAAVTCFVPATPSSKKR